MGASAADVLRHGGGAGVLGSASSTVLMRMIGSRCSFVGGGDRSRVLTHGPFVEEAAPPNEDLAPGRLGYVFPAWGDPCRNESFPRRDGRLRSWRYALSIDDFV